MKFTAQDLISFDILPLRTSDSGESALNIMNMYQVRHLPIVNNEKLLGMISEDEILDHDSMEPVGSYQLSLQRPFCFGNEHIFEVMSKMSQNSLTVIPVVDRKEMYLGVILLEDLLKYYAESYAFRERGTIIVLEVPRLNYSLAELARITESEGALILSSFVNANQDSNILHVTLKLNQVDPGRLISNFERFNYHIVGSFTDVEIHDSLKERYELLMNYLNV
jgi:acetoin utilization protein AcuB